MTISTVNFIVAMAPILLHTEQNLRKIRGYIIPDHIEIHCEVSVVPFKDLSQMSPREMSMAIREFRHSEVAAPISVEVGRFQRTAVVNDASKLRD